VIVATRRPAGCPGLRWLIGDDDDGIRTTVGPEHVCRATKVSMWPALLDGRQAIEQFDGHARLGNGKDFESCFADLDGGTDHSADGAWRIGMSDADVSWQSPARKVLRRNVDSVD